MNRLLRSSLENNPLTLDNWKQRWEDGLIGWHKSNVYPALIKYFDRLDLKPGDQIFVPLCGGSVDMQWLADRGLIVIGCEISGKAIADFFQSVDLQPEKQQQGELICWQAGPYTLYEGDYFKLQPDDLADVKAVYDRASLIALPKEGDAGRKAYVRKMRELVGDDVKTLLITLDYDQSELGGPPYSVGYEEAVWQYSFDHIIEFLAEEDILQEEPHLKQQGLSKLTEWVYLMTRYTPIYADFTEIPQDF